MRKPKFLTLLLAGIMTLSMGMFAACGDTKPVEEAAKLTDGYYLTTVPDGVTRRRQMIKFYEDGTFYAEEFSGTTHRGQYVLHTNTSTTINYLDYANDGNYDGGDSQTVYQTTSYIEFKDEVGNPSTVIYRDDNPSGLVTVVNDGVDTNFIAYANDCIHSVKIVNYGKSLHHDKNATFTKDDEKAVLLSNWMVTNNFTEVTAVLYQQLFSVEIYDKKFVETVTSSTAKEGTYTKNEKVYTFTYEDQTTATFTIGANDDTATIKKGEGAAIDLVPFKEAPETAAEFTGETSDTPPKDIIFNLFEDGTFVIGIGDEVVRGTYECDPEYKTITMLEDSSEFDFVSGSYDANYEVTIVLTIGSDITFTGEASGALYGDRQLVASVGGKIAGGYADFTLELYDEGTAIVKTDSAAGGKTEDVGSYYLNADNTVTLRGFEDCQAVITEITVDNEEISLNVYAIGAEGDVPNLTGTVIGTLVSVKLQKSADDTNIGTNNASYDLKILSNGKLIIDVSMSGTVIATLTGSWVATVQPSASLTFVIDAGTGTLAGTTGTMTWAGEESLSLSLNPGNYSATFATSYDELGGLMS